MSSEAAAIAIGSEPKVSTSPLPLRAGAGGRVLVSTERSGGGEVPLVEELVRATAAHATVETIERCEASSKPATKPKSGASPMALARALRRWLERGILNYRRGPRRPNVQKAP